MTRTFSRRFMSVCRTLAFSAILSLLAGAAAADPIYRDATQPGTDWFIADNWYNAATNNDAWTPAPDDIVCIGDDTYLVNAIVDIATSQGLATAGTLTLGRDLGSTGALNLSDGLLQVSGFLTVGGDGTGALSQTGGSLQTIATGVGAPGLVDPTLPSSGHFDQTGGTHIISPNVPGEFSLLGVGGGIGATGTYSLSGADPQLQAPATVVGFIGGAGAFTHTAGTHLITSDYAPVGDLVPGLDFPGLFLGFGWVVEEGSGEDIDIGYPSTGSYALTGGALTITRSPALPGPDPPIGAVVWLGTSGTGTLLLGDANGTGILNEADPPSPTGDEVGVSLLLRPSPFEGGDTATLRGWGAPSLTGVLLNNGRVIADGYGQDRDLDLRSFSLVTSSAGIVNIPLLQSDGTQAGWYAQDHGRLLLPTYTMDMGGGSYTVRWGTAPSFFGEAPGLPVNSLRILLDGLVEEPSFSIALLAPDRADVPFGTTGSVLGIWDIQMDGELPEGTEGVLNIRYDDFLASTMGLAEEDIGLFHFTGGQWYDITAGLNTETNEVWGYWNALSVFAVGSNIRLQQQAAIPEPASLALLALGGLGLLRRRRRRS